MDSFRNIELARGIWCFIEMRTRLCVTGIIRIHLKTQCRPLGFEQLINAESRQTPHQRYCVDSFV